MAIPVAAIVSAIGGVRATAFLGLSLAVAAALGVQTLRLKSTQGEIAKVTEGFQAYRENQILLTGRAATLAAQARVEFYEAQARAESSFQAGRESAIEYQATVVADLRSGNVRLRNGWEGCLSAAPAGQAATSVAIGSDGASGVQAEAFGRVLRVGEDADNEVRWLQSELLATRQLAENCGKTGE